MQPLSFGGDYPIHAQKLLVFTTSLHLTISLFDICDPRFQAR